MEPGTSSSDNFYRINSVTMTDCPPIGNLHLDFTSKLNLVFGDNGSGKSSIIQALRSEVWPHGGTLAINSEGNRNILQDHWTNVLIDHQVYERTNETRPPNHWTLLSKKHPAMLRRVSALLIDMLRIKLGAWSKFEGIPYCGPETLNVEVNSQGYVAVHPGPPLLASVHEIPDIYPKFEHLFLANDERFLIQLSGILAAREFVGIDCPLIVDCEIGHHDEFHRHGIMAMLHKLGQQVIVFESASNFDCLQRLFRPGDSVIRPYELNNWDYLKFHSGIDMVLQAHPVSH